ncbi:MAG TPA: hypothetical protein VI306_01495 [Pyrinomonadaceae bacterium]
MEIFILRLLTFPAWTYNGADNDNPNSELNRPNGEHFVKVVLEASVN